MQRLGVEVETIKSTSEADYTDLVLVEAIQADGLTKSASGTLLGTANSPRLVALNGRGVEADPSGALLIYENHDEPGIIGMVGTLLGREKINIAAMSLSRNNAGGTALCILNLDSQPSETALKELTSHRAIKQAVVVNL
jgi:D-3-phosphoglycerate dehydrogenase